LELKVGKEKTRQEKVKKWLFYYLNTQENTQETLGQTEFRSMHCPK
jgi:hypothetical protein